VNAPAFNEEHRIAVAAMRAAERVRRLRNQFARARSVPERESLRRQTARIEAEVIMAANMFIERASLHRARA